jgi:hypothetical protein
MIHTVSSEGERHMGCVPGSGRGDFPAAGAIMLVMHVEGEEPLSSDSRGFEKPSGQFLGLIVMSH